MKTIRVLAALILFSLSWAKLSCPDSPPMDTKSLLQEITTQIKSHFRDTRKVADLLARDPSEVLSELKMYESDPSDKVRNFAYTLAWRIGITHAKPEKIRTQVVERLVKACGDSDGLVWQSASRRLLSFPPQYFSDKAKQSIRSLLTRSGRQGHAILLAGQANMTDDIPAIRQILATTDDSDYWKWLRRLALARLGSREDILYCIQRVELEPRDVTRIAKMLHGLGYMRQPEAVLVLAYVLDSDDYLPSTKNESLEGVAYAQYALDILANILEGFPVRARGAGSYSLEDIEKARAWIRTQATVSFTTEPTTYWPRF